MQTIEEYKEYTRQLEGEVKKWHDAYDASEVVNRQLAKQIDPLQRDIVRLNADYPLHPGQIHAEPYYCTIPLEEYESMKKRIVQLEKDNAALELANKNLMESVASLNEMKSKEYELDMRERELNERERK